VIRYKYVLQHGNHIREGYTFAETREEVREYLKKKYPNYSNLEMVNMHPYKKRNRYTVEQTVTGSDLIVN